MCCLHLVSRLVGCWCWRPSETGYKAVDDAPGRYAYRPWESIQEEEQHTKGHSPVSISESSAMSAAQDMKRSRERKAVQQVSEPGPACGWMGWKSYPVKGSPVIAWWGPVVEMSLPCVPWAMRCRGQRWKQYLSCATPDPQQQVEERPLHSA